MGLLHDFRREFIACPDEFKGQLLYKWPDQDIRKFAQVTVEADELAVFFRDGKVQGTLTPGRYTMDSSLVPFLADLVDVASGGNMYKTELYFIATHEFVNQTFGGEIDNVTDPQTSLAVGLHVFGEYALKVIDPVALIVNFLGSTNAYGNEAVTDWAADLILKTLRTDVVGHMVSNGWPIVGISAHTDDIERETLEATSKQLAPYGLVLSRMGNFTITIDQADQKTLKDYVRDASYTKLAGGFTQYGAGEALRGIGEGAAKGDASGSQSPTLLGLGVGLAGLVAQMNARPMPGTSGSISPTQGATACPGCGAANASGAKFCSQCGSAIAVHLHCTACGAESPTGATFCQMCGVRL